MLINMQRHINVNLKVNSRILFIVLMVMCVLFNYIMVCRGAPTVRPHDATHHFTAKFVEGRMCGRVMRVVNRFIIWHDCL